MALAVESVKSGKRSHDYWPVERRWIAGDTAAIIRESAARVQLESTGAAPRPDAPASGGQRRG